MPATEMNLNNTNLFQSSGTPDFTINSMMNYPSAEQPDSLGYVSYSAQVPEHPEWFIHEYREGRKVLVEINRETGRTHFLRQL